MTAVDAYYAVVPRGTERPGYTTPQDYGLPLGGYGLQQESSPFGN
jgi:hypothetical protein